MQIFSVAQMQAAERTATENGHSYGAMMETAGRRIAEAIQQRVDVAGRNVLILVGPGNNGGDGLVAGHYLADAGADVAFYLYKDRDPETDQNYARIQQRGLFALVSEYDMRYRTLRTRLNITDILVDALLGTGVARPIEGPMAQLLRQVAAGLEERRRILAAQNQPSLLAVDDTSPRPPPRPYVVAVDVPSGLNCDTGALDPLTLTADLTVTFARPKRGHFLFPGAGSVGELVVADIGIKEAWLPASDVKLLTAVDVAAMLPERPLGGHKGTFGSLLISGGSIDYLGAPILSALGAYRSGAGVVALAVPSRLRLLAASLLPEATFPYLPDEETLGSASAEQLIARLDRYQALLIGPGLGSNSDDLLQPLLAAADLPPLIIDADGLNFLARQENWWQMLPANSVLTPHPGEMRRLSGKSIEDSQRIDVARDAAQKWNQIVVLKGAYTVVATPDGTATIVPIATPLLATAGSGDVLAGVIAGLRAQGADAASAARAGAWLHAAAGKQLSLTLGDAGLLAHQLAATIATVRRRVEKSQPSSV